MTPTGTLPARLLPKAAALFRQMDWNRGLRAAVALCTPLVVGELAGFHSMGWAALHSRLLVFSSR
jgi:hypothetical protein